MIDRMVRAALLQPQAYEEAERGGPSMTVHALLVVAITSAMAGIGAGLNTDVFSDGFIAGVAADVLGWLLWAAVVYFIGTRVFSSRTTFGSVARTLGFAYAPGALLILGFLPLVGWLVYVVVFVWRMITGVIALNVGLKINPLFTLLTVVLALLPRLVLGWIVGVVLDVGYV